MNRTSDCIGAHPEEDLTCWRTSPSENEDWQKHSGFSWNLSSFKKTDLFLIAGENTCWKRLFSFIVCHAHYRGRSIEGRTTAVWGSGSQWHAHFTSQWIRKQGNMNENAHLALPSFSTLEPQKTLWISENNTKLRSVWLWRHPLPTKDLHVTEHLY